MTLAEVLVAMVILSLVVAGISATLAISWRNQETLQSQNEMQKRAQQAMDAIVDGMRRFSVVQTGQASSVTLAQLNKDGNTLRTLRCYLQNGQVKRDRYEVATGQTVTGEVLCRSVSALSFTYCRLHFVNYLPKIEPILLSESIQDTQSLRVSVTLTSGKQHASETSLVKLRNAS